MNSKLPPKPKVMTLPNGLLTPEAREWLLQFKKEVGEKHRIFTQQKRKPRP